MKRFTVFANNEKVTVFCSPRKIGSFYKHIVSGLRAYNDEIKNKSDGALIVFLTKNYFQKYGFKCKNLDEVNFKIDLYNDFNLEEGWTIYKGVKIEKAKNSHLFKIGNSTSVVQYYEECFPLIDKEL